MLLAVNVVGGFMVTTICDVGGFRVTITSRTNKQNRFNNTQNLLDLSQY